MYKRFVVSEMINTNYEIYGYDNGELNRHFLIQPFNPFTGQPFLTKEEAISYVKDQFGFVEGVDTLEDDVIIINDKNQVGVE